jgi:hypothetical protein
VLFECRRQPPGQFISGLPDSGGDGATAPAIRFRSSATRRASFRSSMRSQITRLMDPRRLPARRITPAISGLVFSPSVTVFPGAAVRVAMDDSPTVCAGDSVSALTRPQSRLETVPLRTVPGQFRVRRLPGAGRFLIGGGHREHGYHSRTR